MVVKSSVSLQFQRADARSEFERGRRDLKNTLLEGGEEEGATRLAELAAHLDTGVARVKRELLASSLCWNDEHQQLNTWIYQQHRGIVEMAARLVEAMRRQRKPDVHRLAALTLHHWAESLKWTMWRERHDYEPLHDLLLMAMAAERHREPLTWVADGRGQETTLEAMYFRTLLLDRFTGGSLTRQQVEVFDAWLWEWSRALRGEREAPAGAFLRVDLDANTGLREGRREGEGAALYLPLAPLEAARRRIVAELHQGRIVPSHGCVAELRIEEHICVLDHLARAFRAPGADGPQRAPRHHAAGSRIEVWVGVQEILSRGIGVGTETGRYRALNLSDASIVQQGTGTRYNDASRRYLWLADTSATGLGFEALDTDAAGIEVGDLLGWRQASGGPIFLARVIRRIPSATSGQVFIGAQFLTQAAQPLRLSQVVTFDNGQADGTYLFVPGDDESGRRDAFLVSEATYELQSTYRAHVGSESFTLKFNRVRHKGRGWILAGFEILPMKRPEPEACIDRDLDFALVLDEPEPTIDDPWSREVRARLVA